MKLKKHVWTKDDLLNWLFVCFIAVKYSLNYLNYVSSIMCLVLRIQIFFQPLVITTYPLKLSSACLDEFFYVLIRCLIFDRASKPGSSRILADYWACHVIYQLKISSTNLMLKWDEFNSDGLSNVVASFFHILQAKQLWKKLGTKAGDHLWQSIAIKFISL